MLAAGCDRLHTFYMVYMGRRTLDISMDLVEVMQVVETKQNLFADRCDVRFGKRSGLELCAYSTYEGQEVRSAQERTRSRHEPPARYSMTVRLSYGKSRQLMMRDALIHSL